MQFKLQKKTLYIQRNMFPFASGSAAFQEMKINVILFLTKHPDTMKCHTVHKSICRPFMTCQTLWEGKPRNPSKPPQLSSLVPWNTTLLLVCVPAHGPHLGGLHSASQHLHLLKSASFDLFSQNLLPLPNEGFLLPQISLNPDLQVWTRPSKLHKTSTSRID